MNQDQARNLVRQTLTESFDKARFRNFVLELLNEFDESKAFTSNKTYIKDAFKNHVERFERLGTYASPDDQKLDVLVVHLTKQSKLERARTAIRNFVADHLKQRDGKDAALVAFVSPAEKQWRFSYVKMEYATVEKDSGKIGVETKLTPARRFSYIVGEGESCHTAQTRFLGLLQDTETAPTLAQVEEAFSVEAVTKEFFKKYAELFGEIQKALDKLAKKDPAIAKEFDKKSVRTADFAKKLMGQIVFLYFIQKKGWLGVEKGKDWGSGPHDFLRRLARGHYGKYENFFNDILEPLFYSTLAEDRGHEAWCKRFNCRIPFLNGGLFEPLAEYDWRKTDIVLPNRLFTNDERFDDFNTGTGLLDMFDRYNFTVNEAEPLEKEVAIDPEMLGKVFENLIEENLRKGLGSYYTPREIVHYMCQESMINYLDTALNSTSETIGREKRKQAEFDDEKSEQTLLAAPTRHEAAPRVDIETFVHLGDQISHYESVDTRYAIKMPKSIEKHARLIDEKLADITICDPAVGSGAFPVGMMSEIVRARSALTPYFNDVRERTPYHFKRHAIHNCLYGVDIDPGAIEIAKLRLWLSLVVDEEDVKQIKPLPNLDYKLVTGNSLLGFPFRSQRLQEVERLKDRFFEEVDHDRKAELKAEIHRKLQECFASSKRSLGYDVDFDFRIYFSEVFDSKGGFDCVIANPPYVDSETMTREDPELRQAVQRSYSFTKGNWDIYIAFYEKGFDVLRRGAAISYITPDKWISKPFGDQLRAKTNDRIFSILKAGRSVFESVLVDAIVTVFINRPEQLLRIYDFEDSRIHLKRTVPKEALTPPYAYDWLFSDHVELLSKLGLTGSTLSEYGNCENACATSDAYKLKDFLQEERGDRDSADFLRIINTGTIGKFVSKWGRKEMVYLGDRYSRPVVNRKRFERAFPNTYGQKAVKPKLIVKGLNLLDASLDADGSVIPGKTTLIITSSDLRTLKVIAAIVNSALAMFYLKERYPASSYNQGTTFTKDMINSLPVPKLTDRSCGHLVSKVDKIIAAKQRNPEADTSALEGEIGELVYTLYGLTPEEIKIVEGAK